MRSYVGESDNFSRRMGNYRNSGPTQSTNIRLDALLTDTLNTGGSADLLWLRYEEIDSIELRPGSTARMVMMTPSTASKIGEVSIVTKQQRRAELSGIPNRGLYDLLTELG